MREIKFRGWKMYYGGWVYGSLIYDKDNTWSTIVDEDVVDHIVETSSVGQYIGLNDNNGKEIYEGDIVDNGHTVVYSSSAHQFRHIGFVKFDVKQGCLVIHNTDENTKRITAKTVQTNKIKVLGNIHDNPELLEVQE